MNMAFYITGAFLLIYIFFALLVLAAYYKYADRPYSHRWAFSVAIQWPVFLLGIAGVARAERRLDRLHERYNGQTEAE